MDRMQAKGNLKKIGKGDASSEYMEQHDLLKINPGIENGNH
jgi:hypothetical protein